MNCFEGVFQTVLKHAQTGRVLSSQRESFNHIILNVKHGNLENALKAALSYQIDKYRFNVHF